MYSVFLTDLCFTEIEYIKLFHIFFSVKSFKMGHWKTILKSLSSLILLLEWMVISSFEIVSIQLVRTSIQFSVLCSH